MWTSESVPVLWLAAGSLLLLSGAVEASTLSEVGDLPAPGHQGHDAPAAARLCGLEGFQFDTLQL